MQLRVKNPNAIFNKVKHRFIIWPSDPTVQYSPKKNENICSHENLYTNAYKSFIYECQKLDVTQMSPDWGTDKQIVGHPHNGMPLNRKKEWTIDMHKNMEESQQRRAKWKKTDPKGSMVGDPIYMVFWKRPTYRDRNQISVARGWAWGGLAAEGNEGSC